MVNKKNGDRAISDISTLSRGDVIVWETGFEFVSFIVDFEKDWRLYLTPGNKNLSCSSRYLYNQAEIDERVEKAGWRLAEYRLS